ncbi:hypothetical protein N7533_010541 [Penicillium manginii]|uniref:uncharacterized protein n=1 Tax=Penicillium manginii TaxID=203109 RepID=UPI0025470BC3|nr:uncharacterized protein N7533_010541 [Penicillium manginii]KAJ5743439.1 hypothetical protein N7533_010541 [Penicillium manginii]
MSTHGMRKEEGWSPNHQALMGTRNRSKSSPAPRAISFQRQLLTGITPHQLAQNGLYHQVRAGVGDIACCFACEAAVPLDAIQENPTGDVSKIHKEDCLWQVICHDLKPFLPSPPPHSHTPSANPSSQFSAVESSSQPKTYPTPTAHTIVNQADPDLETSAELPPARLESVPLAPRPTTVPPQPIQPTLRTTSPPTSQKQTYASVLQQPTTSSPPPTTRPQPTPPNHPLIIEELRRRFHNKPSPFELEKRKKKRQKTTSAAQSLSRFLNSALPAFSRFLVEMQPAADNCWPPRPGTHPSRAMRAA